MILCVCFYKRVQCLRYLHAMKARIHWRKANVNNPSHLSSPFGSVKIPRATLPSYVFKYANSWPGENAITCGISDRSYCYSTLELMISRLSEALIGGCKCETGETLAVILPDIPEVIGIIYGAFEAGLRVLPLNMQTTADEINRQLLIAKAKIIVTIEYKLPIVESYQKLIKDYRGTILVDGSQNIGKKIFSLQALTLSNYSNVNLPNVQPKEEAIVAFTSGYYGQAKAVVLTHERLCINLSQMRHHHLSRYVKFGKGFIMDVHHDAILSLFPIHNLFGFNVAINPNLYHGNHVIILPRISVDACVKVLEKYKPKSLYMPSAQLFIMAIGTQYTTENLKSIKEVIFASTPLTKFVLDKFRMKLCPEVIIRQAYYLTEASPLVMLSPRKAPHGKSHSCGQLCPGTSAKVVDVKTRLSMGPNEPGKLFIKGPQIVDKYLDDNISTKINFDESWLDTGDYVKYDSQQFFYVLCKTKDLIKVKDQWVSPTELESIIAEYDEILDAAVVGVPDAKGNETLKAYIVLHSDCKIMEEDIILNINKRLASYKQLKKVQIVDSIPRNSNGEILRDNLRIKK